MHTQLEKYWKHLCRMTDLPLCGTSRRPSAEPRVSRDLLFSVSRVSRDVSAAVVLITWEVVEPLSASEIAFKLVCSHCLRRPRARQCIAIGMRYPKTRFANSNSDRIKI